MMYMCIAFGMIVFAICYCIVFYLCYMAIQRKTVREHQEEWDRIRAELEENGADYIEIAEAYGRYIEVCGGCFPGM